jgi:signal transduction histidine kinase
VDATLRRRSPGLECGPYVHLAVHDQGEGVSLSIQERIFRPFFTTRDTGTHTGMGLAIVRGVATNHNGAVFVDRREGGGSVFRVFVPRVGAT